jgi:hypothetical protein
MNVGTGRVRPPLYGVEVLYVYFYKESEQVSAVDLK